MKTSTLVMLGLLATLAIAGHATADAESSDQAKACEPVYIDNDGDVHVNQDCIGPPPSDRPLVP